jgi:hypothetical protein
MAKATMDVEHNQKIREEPVGSPIKKAKDWASLLVTALPIFGAAGTLFVWVFASFYVGNVEIKTALPYQAIFVQVFNEKGSENEFRSPRFQLMPGNYLLRVSLDSKPPKNLHALVKYNQETLVPFDDNVPALQNQKDETEEAVIEQKAAKKHWWQFWRK